MGWVAIAIGEISRERGRKVDGANFMISLAVRENKSDKGESG